MLQKFAIIASLAAIASAWHQQQAYAPRPVHGKRQFHGSQKQVHAPVRAKKEQPRLARAHYGQKVLSHVPVRAATNQFDRDYRVDGYHTDRDQKKLASGKSFQAFNKSYGPATQGVRSGRLGGHAPIRGHGGYGGGYGYGAPARGGYGGFQRPGRPSRPQVPALRGSQQRGGFSHYARGGKPDKYRYDVGESAGKGGIAGYGPAHGDAGGSIDKDRKYDGDQSYDIRDKNHGDFDALKDINKDSVVDYDESGNYGEKGGINKDSKKDYDTSKDKRNKSGNGGHGGYGYRRGGKEGKHGKGGFNDDGFGGANELEFQAEAENGAEEIEDASQTEYSGELETGREFEMSSEMEVNADHEVGIDIEVGGETETQGELEAEGEEIESTLALENTNDYNFDNEFEANTGFDGFGSGVGADAIQFSAAGGAAQLGGIAGATVGRG